MTEPGKPSGWTLKSGSKARESVEPEEKDVTLWKLLVFNVCRLQIVELGAVLTSHKGKQQQKQAGEGFIKKGRSGRRNTRSFSHRALVSVGPI